VTGKGEYVPQSKLVFLLLLALTVRDPMNHKPNMRKYTKKDFDRQFPDAATCLEWLKRYRYPNNIFCKKCNQVTKHHRTTSRPSYCCQYCGHHLHPTAGTIFQKSTTPLTTWFYTVYLMASTRCGISAKQIERETGVAYSTAWRMVTRIRSMLAEGTPIGGYGVGNIRMSAEKTQLRHMAPSTDSAKSKKQDNRDDQPFTIDDFVTALEKASRKISRGTKKVVDI
jgi:transposase-like protein